MRKLRLKIGSELISLSNEMFYGKTLFQICGEQELLKTLNKNLIENGLNSFEDLSCFLIIVKEFILNRHLKNNIIVDKNTTFIDYDVEIASGVRIEPNNTIKGRSQIKGGVLLECGNIISDSIIYENAVIKSSFITEASVGKNSAVGPFAYLRPETVIGEHCRIGNFVEIKKSRVGNGTKISHLAYVGDAEIGQKCNIGCGVVFVNYDGKNKHKTFVGDEVFIGSNCNLIAPLEIENNAFIAAGSTITKNIPPFALAIAREREVIKENWIKEKRT